MSSRPTRLRKSGNFIELSHLPAQEVVQRLHKEFTYDHLISLHGKEAYDRVGGIRRPVRTERRKLYCYDEFKRLIVPVGFLSRVQRILTAAGCEFTYEDIDPPRVRSDCYETNWDLVFEKLQLRPGQDELLVAIASNDRGLIQAPPGMGKTLLTAAVGLLYPKAKICLAVTSVDVANRMFSELHKFLPNVGQTGGGRRLKGRRINVYTSESLHHCDADCDILLVDEVHTMATPTRAARLARFALSRNYGLSATVTGRGDNADIELEAFFGPVIYEVPYQEAQSNRVVLPIRVVWHSVHMDTNLNPCSGLIDVAKKRAGLWRNEYRNQIIADAARSFGDAQCLIIVEVVEHAVYLGSLLPEFTLVYGDMDPNKRARYIREGLLPADHGPFSRERREKLRLEFESGKLRKVIATGVWNTGVSFDQLQVLIRADGAGSEILATQIPGRISRLSEGKECGYLIDFMDEFDPAFRRKAQKRKRNYESHGWEQLEYTGLGQLAHIGRTRATVH